VCVCVCVWWVGASMWVGMGAGRSLCSVGGYVLELVFSGSEWIWGKEGVWVGHWVVVRGGVGVFGR
jgi:hypothetical protein